MPVLIISIYGFSQKHQGSFGIFVFLLDKTAPALYDETWPKCHNSLQ